MAKKDNLKPIEVELKRLEETTMQIHEELQQARDSEVKMRLARALLSFPPALPSLMPAPPALQGHQRVDIVSRAVLFYLLHRRALLAELLADPLFAFLLQEEETHRLAVAPREVQSHKCELIFAMDFGFALVFTRL